jgi:hypothetical protein
MTWLVLAYFLSFGTLNYVAGPDTTPWVQSPANSYQTTLGVEAQMINNHLFAGGTVGTWESSDGNLFAPWESLYTFNAGFRYAGFELGYMHECDHVTLSVGDPMLGLPSNKDEFYVSYRSRIKVF